MSGGRCFIIAYYYSSIATLSIVAENGANYTNYTSSPEYSSNDTLVTIDHVTHPSKSIKYYLYKNNEFSMTWNESYAVCKDRGQSLAVLDTMDLQRYITNLNMSGVSKIWIAGRRKDYGSNWTWITDNLIDVSDNYTILKKDDESRECARIVPNNGSMWEIWADLCHLPKYFICQTDKKILRIRSNTRSWDNAMNICVNKSGRLATWQANTFDGEGESFWLGIRKRPWVWINSDEEKHPVLSSSWAFSSSGGDCMVLLSNGSWKAEECSQQLSYTLCEEHIQPINEPVTSETTGGANNTASKTPQNESKGSVILAASLVSVAVIILIVVLLALHLMKRGRKNAITSTNNNRASGDCQSAKSTQHAVDSVEAVSPYAEASICYQPLREPRFSRSGYVLTTTPHGTGQREPTYSLAKHADNREGGEKAVVYTEVIKPKSDATTLFENVIYEPSKREKKKGPPKPPRATHMERI